MSLSEIHLKVVINFYLIIFPNKKFLEKISSTKLFFRNKDVFMTSKALFLTVFLTLNLSLFSQPTPQELGLLGEAVDGIERIAASLIADSFSPMTHYKANDRFFQLTPLYFEVEKLAKDSEWEAKDLNGFALGAGYGHAFSSSLLFYGIATFLNIEGKLESSLQSELSFKLLALSSGIGYDLLSDNKTFSLPLFAGIVLQYYSVDSPVTVPSLPGVPVTLEGNGLVLGLSAGIAFSAQFFDWIKATPYLLVLQNLNSYSLAAKTQISFPLPQTLSADVPMETKTMGMFGFNIALIPSENWDISVILGGTLSSLSQFHNDTFLNGLRIKTYGLSVTYKK